MNLDLIVIERFKDNLLKMEEVTEKYLNNEKHNDLCDHTSSINAYLKEIENEIRRTDQKGHSHTK